MVMHWTVNPAPTARLVRSQYSPPSPLGQIGKVVSLSKGEGVLSSNLRGGTRHFIGQTVATVKYLINFIPMIQIETIETNDKLGYYTVGQAKIHHKPLALMLATKVDQFPEWHFNREVFDPYPWTHEPEISLNELYRTRAQQLREKYDYIRLEFSGGADSTMVLYSFLQNGIHLDEIVTRWPKAGEKFVPDDPFNTKPENTLSEWRYAAKPMLDWVASNFPNIKITLHDFSEDMLTGVHDESWIYRAKDWLLPSYPFKTAIDALDDHKRTLDQGRSICVLWGVDKPKVCIKDSKFYAYFMDLQANNCSSDIGHWTNVTNEYFYWTPDLPALVCKQAHIVKNWFNQPVNYYLQHLIRWPNYSVSQRAAYESIVKPLVFPEYNPSTFQVGKPSNSFYNEMDSWFYPNFKKSGYYQAWQSGLKYLENKIDAKYFNYELKKPTGFVGFVSPFYCLGDAVFVDSKSNTHFKF